MRFPFFATNKQLDRAEKNAADGRDGLLQLFKQNQKWILDEQQLRQKLEGRVSKLEPNKTPAWNKRYYTRKEWSRMNKESRKRLFAKMDAREQKYTLKIEEAIKSGRNKRN